LYHDGYSKAIIFQAWGGHRVDYVHEAKTAASGWVGTNRWWFKSTHDFVIGAGGSEAKGKSQKGKRKKQK
jgi:hypothetical protein